MFIGENQNYRAAREELFEAERDLVAQRERVAALRRDLPMARVVATDYVFREGPTDLSRNDPSDFFDTRLQDLFADGKDSLIVYHFMFTDAQENPCIMCSMWADGLNAVAPHVMQRSNFALVAKAEIGKFRRFARERGWNRIRLLSSQGSEFNRDYLVESDSGAQSSGVSVFRRSPDGMVQHFYSSEMRKERGIDLFSPVWHLFDLLPEGRGEWLPAHDYMPPSAGEPGP